MNNSKFYYMDEENFFEEAGDLNLQEGPILNKIGSFASKQVGKLHGIPKIVDREVHKFPDPALHPIETLKRNLIDKHSKNPMELKGKVRGADKPLPLGTDEEKRAVFDKLSSSEKSNYYKAAGVDKEAILKSAAHKHGDEVHMNNWKHLFLKPVVKDEQGNLSDKGYDFVKRSGERVVGHKVAGKVKAAGAMLAGGAAIAAGGGDPLAPVTGTAKLAKNTVKAGANIIGTGANMIDTVANASDNAMSFKDKIKAAGDKVVGAASNVKKKFDDTPTTTKAGIAAGAGVAAVAGTALAKKLVDRVNEKLDWKVEGCDKITDPDKKSKCKEYIRAQKAKELQSSLSKCDDANNPEDCKKTIQAEIKKNK